MFWKIIMVVAFMFYPCIVNAEIPAKGTNGSEIDVFRLFNLSEDDIKSVVVYSRIIGHKTLTKNEILLLITILHKVRKENVEIDREPFPKGGPPGMTLLLKSDEKLTLTLNGEYILYGRNRVYLPEIRQFMDRIKPPTN